MRPLVTAGMTLGIGLGGFVDGILFHQILQLHNMTSGRRYPDDLVSLEIGMFWDGVFHAVTWTTTVIGVGLLWRVAQRREVPLSTPVLVGSALGGWGLFNLVEGVVDHHLLHLHHVVERLGVSVYDGVFLASGVGLMVLGALIARRT